MTQNVKTWLLSLAICMLLSCSYLLDGPDEVESKRADVAALADAQRMAAEEAQIERAATQICVKLNGPGHVHQWTVDGKLTCKPITQT